jgi:hypothetical protein
VPGNHQRDTLAPEPKQGFRDQSSAA